MDLSNGSEQSGEAKVHTGGAGGGPHGWHRIEPGGHLHLDLPPNTLWEVECRVAGTQLGSTIQARSDDEIHLVLTGARLRPHRVSKEPIQA